MYPSLTTYLSSGDVDEVQALIDSKINVDGENYDRRTPLHLVST